MKYPRQHTIDNPKLKQLLVKKNDLVLEGRELSQEIEDIEAKQKAIDDQIKVLESKVDLKEFEERAADTTNQMQALMNEANEIQKLIYAKLKSEVPPELGQEYDELKAEKEELENKRNKIGLKIQKTKDLIIPLTQKVAKDVLQDEFEDFSDVTLENDELTIYVISHLENWKEARAKKLKEKYLPQTK